MVAPSLPAVREAALRLHALFGEGSGDLQTLCSTVERTTERLFGSDRCTLLLLEKEMLQRWAEAPRRAWRLPSCQHRAAKPLRKYHHHVYTSSPASQTPRRRAQYRRRRMGCTRWRACT